MRECANCGAQMQEGQDWCVQCGAARAGLTGRRPGWLTGAAVLVATVLLVAGASVAAYAALTKSKPKAPPRLALKPTTASPTTPATPGTTTTPPPTGTPGSPTGTPSAPTGAAPPKIPTSTPTPSSIGGKESNPLFPPEAEKGSKSSKSGKSSKAKPAGKGSTKGSSEGLTGEGIEGAGGKGSSGPGSESGSKEEGPEAILLDPNAASTYDPNSYPSSLFGDPSLTIDGESSTAWTAALQASIAPKVQAGVLLDMRTAQKLGSATIETKTPGITIEMYGANGANPPTSIGDSAWKKLHGARLLKKKKVTIKLQTKGAAYRFVLLWIVKAPASSTAAKPGSVGISELELFPPK